MTLSLAANQAVAADCKALPNNGVNWQGCDFHGRLQERATLSGADLPLKTLRNEGYQFCGSLQQH